MQRGRRVVNPTFNQADYTEDQWQGLLEMLRWEDGPNNPKVKQGGFASQVTGGMRPKPRPASNELYSAGSMTNMLRDDEGNFYDMDGTPLPPSNPTYNNKNFMSAQSNIKETAQDLSEMGRYGDTEVVHVNPQEVEMLKKMGGSGTINPETGLREFFFGEYTSFTDMFDGGGAGGSGSEYFSGSHEDYVKETGDSRASAHIINDDGDEEAEHGTFRRITGYDDFEDTYDGGGMGAKGDTYGAGNFLHLDTGDKDGEGDGDNYISQGEIDKAGLSGLEGGIDGDNDSILATVTNTALLLANPIAYAAGSYLKNNVLDLKFSDLNFGGDGEDVAEGELTGGEKAAQFLKDMKNTEGDNNDAVNAVNAVDATDTAVQEDANAYLEGTYGEYDPDKYESGLSTSTNGAKFINYNYADGFGTPIDSYKGEAKPLVMSFGSRYTPATWAKTETASNEINSFIMDLPADLQDDLVGNINVIDNGEDGYVLYVGDEATGYTEATYALGEDGYASLMSDVEKMFLFANTENDTNFNGGFIGRTNSYNSFVNQLTDDIQYDKTLLVAELGLLDPTSIGYEQAAQKLNSEIDFIDRELARRSGDDLSNQAAYSLAAMEHKTYLTALAKMQAA